MRIGVLTFHEIHNPGAFWQAYATVQLLKSWGHDAVIIHYTSPAHRYRFLRKLCHPMTIRHPRNFCETRGKVLAYKKAQTQLPLTNLLKTHGDVENERFDAVIVGSDIVWDFQSRRLGQDPVYFGKHLNADRLIAYAPSCGSCSFDEVLPGYVREGLPKFNSISVRDANTQALVKRVLSKEAPIIGDPTFNLDFHGLERAPDVNKPYLCVYAMKEYVSDAFKSAVSDFAKANDLEIVAVGYRNSWADRNAVFADPFEWLGWLKGAQYVATNTFHGTLFSIYLEKQFVVELNPAISKKTKILLDELDLSARVLQEGCNIEKIMNIDWRSEKVFSAIECKAKSARDYLWSALSTVED